MKAKDLIAKLQELDPDEEIFFIEPNYDWSYSKKLSLQEEEFWFKNDSIDGYVIRGDYE